MLLFAVCPRIGLVMSKPCIAYFVAICGVSALVACYEKPCIVDSVAIYGVSVRVACYEPALHSRFCRYLRCVRAAYLRCLRVWGVNC